MDPEDPDQQHGDRAPHEWIRTPSGAGSRFDEVEASSSAARAEPTSNAVDFERGPQATDTAGVGETDARRRRRTPLFLLVLLLAIVGGGLLIGSFGQDDDPVQAPKVAGRVTPSTPPVGAGGRGGAVGGVDHEKALLDGVKQTPLTIGDGPITIIEFVDFQCPFCAQHEIDVQPAAVQELVRTGRARITMLPLAFLGDDSEIARQVYLKLSERGLGWQFADLMFRNQGTENSGYVTRAYLESLLAQIPGAKPSDADPTPNRFSRGWSNVIDRLARRSGVTGTPSFAVGRTGAPLATFQGVGPDFSAALQLLAFLEQGGPGTTPAPSTPPGSSQAPGGSGGQGTPQPAPSPTPDPSQPGEAPGGAVTT